MIYYTVAGFSHKRLKIGFPLLVQSNKIGENREMGHELMGHKPNANTLNATIIGS